MARLSMAERRALPKSDFAVPSKAPGPGSYPIEDAAHRAAAAGFAAMHHPGSALEHKVDAAVHRKAHPKQAGLNRVALLSHMRG